MPCALGWPKNGAAEESVGGKHLTVGTQSGALQQEAGLETIMVP